MILLQLYLAFFKIGLFTFGGGYASLPLIKQIIVEEHGWLEMQEMTDIVAISQMTPGPISINAATFVGTKIAFIPGSIVATAGFVTPSFIVMLLLGKLINSNRDISVMDRALNGLRPGVVGLIATAAISMFLSAVFSGQFATENLQILSLITFIMAFVLSMKDFGMVKIILLSAGVGIVLAIAFPGLV